MSLSLSAADYFRRRVISAMGLWIGILVILSVGLRHLVAALNYYPVIFNLFCL